MVAEIKIRLLETRVLRSDGIHTKLLSRVHTKHLVELKTVNLIIYRFTRDRETRRYGGGTFVFPKGRKVQRKLDGWSPCPSYVERAIRVEIGMRVGVRVLTLLGRDPKAPRDGRFEGGLRKGKGQEMRGETQRS